MKPTPAQTRRLRELYRSAGWPCLDTLELELLALGWLERLQDPDGRERLRLTEAGIQAAALGLQGNRARRDAHEDLVLRTATELQRAGRLVWTGLSLRAGLAREEETEPGRIEPTLIQPPSTAPLKKRWLLCQPDVYSLYPSSKPQGLAVAIHEIKVRRGDLLSDLRRTDKRAAYAALSGQTWFVLAAGIAEVQEIPEGFGVWIAHAAHFELGRPAPQRPHGIDHATFLALAKASPLPFDNSAAQPSLTDA
ncbi:hypothetical protein HNQ51_002208 [Inhella inkyongensis]|uniref:Uncharacterized protein n=1 Tax=Inhella inkyongensis TaxID=392593 RepID=A0A840S8Z9_9BURK|nr:hypothetical protein [Inhella inkyongensis]MBB5204889.1 hypothetical protein [Inhella inkyongensis]